MMIFNASEARNLSNKSIKSDFNKQKKEIVKEINAAIRNGKYEVYYYKELLLSVNFFFMDLKYTIKDISNQKDGYCYIISW